MEQKEVLIAEESPILTIRLVNQQESSWILEGTENSADPIKMAFPSLYRIVPHCKVAYKDDKGVLRHKQIRHIAGCDSIDPKWQDENGYVPDPQMDNIWVANGVAVFERSGESIGTYDYLKQYQGNISAKDRPKDAADEFEEVNDVELAEQIIVDFREQFDAMNILNSLMRYENGAYEYDEESIDQICSVLNIKVKSPAEKVAVLTTICATNPKLVTDSIANQSKKVIHDVRKAETLQTITFSDDKVVFNETKAVILAFKKKHNRISQVNKLVDFLSSKDGEPFYGQLLILNEKAAANSLSGPELPQ